MSRTRMVRQELLKFGNPGREYWMTEKVDSIQIKTYLCISLCPILIIVSGKAGHPGMAKGH